jgi:hypothetical protein
MRIRLEKATKSELVAAIKALPMFDAVDRAEKSIYWHRQQSLMDRMHAISDKLDATKGKKSIEGHKNWLALHEEHERIYNQLRELQEQ